MSPVKPVTVQQVIKQVPGLKGKSPNVIVVPIQISKEMIAAKQSSIKLSEASATAGTSSPAAGSSSSTEVTDPKLKETAKIKLVKADTSKDAAASQDAKEKESDKEKETKDKDKISLKEKVAEKAKDTPAAKAKKEAKEVKSETKLNVEMTPTRRSKRSSNLSSKLAEWGLVPASGMFYNFILSNPQG